MNDTEGASQSPATPKVDAELEREIAEAMGDASVEELMEQSVPPPEPSRAPAADAHAHGEDRAPAHGGDRAHAPAHGRADADDDSQHFTAELVRGRISALREKDVFVDLPGVSGKSQGVVPLDQFERPPRVGSIMDFVVQRRDEAEGLVILSREGAVGRMTWEQLTRGAIVEARVVGKNKGGLELELVGGVRAFMPASQVDLGFIEDLGVYVGQKLTAIVQEIDRRGRKVLLSRRQHLQHQRELAKRMIWDQLEVGQVVDGKVSNVMDYGAFVDIGGVDGLVHVSDMAYTRVNNPADVVKVGQEVKVKVLKLDPEKERISLGLKQVEPDPWDTVVAGLAPGETLSGRVVRLADFGAFVEVQPGVEGLLPISEISWKRIHHPSETLSEGDVVRVKVLRVSPDDRKLSLSLKQAAGDPWENASFRYAPKSLVDATVRSVTDFGAFVELEEGVEGLVHISELADRRVNNVEEVLKVGDRQQFRVLDIDPEQRRIRLSLRQVAEPAPDQPGDRGGRRAEAAPLDLPNKAGKKKRDERLSGGMGDHGGLGIGLGDLKL
jgi:small subunit ribosomal protein S1